MNEKILKIVSSFLDETSQRDLKIEDTKFGQSIKIKSSLVFRIKNDMKNIFRIEFTKNKELAECFKNNKDVIEKESSFQFDVIKDEKELLKLIESLQDSIITQVKRIISNYRVDSFGCCSHYLECSKEGKCIMVKIDPEFYNGCQYKVNLESGKNFYK